MLSNITDEQRGVVLANATPQQLYLCSNPESGGKLRTIAVNNDITEESLYTKFALIVGDVILNLLTTQELLDKLTESLNLPTEQAAKITTEIINFTKETKAIVSKEVEKTPHSTKVNQEDIVYTSTQNDLLTKKLEK